MCSIALEQATAKREDRRLDLFGCYGHNTYVYPWPMTFDRKLDGLLAYSVPIATGQTRMARWPSL